MVKGVLAFIGRLRQVGSSNEDLRGPVCVVLQLVQDERPDFGQQSQ